MNFLHSVISCKLPIMHSSSAVYMCLYPCEPNETNLAGGHSVVCVCLHVWQFLYSIDRPTCIHLRDRKRLSSTSGRLGTLPIDHRPDDRRRCDPTPIDSTQSVISELGLKARSRSSLQEAEWSGHSGAESQK